MFGITFVLHLSEHINISIMKRRSVTYFSKNKALKILERPLENDLHTFLSATFALSHNRIVKNHIQDTILQLATPSYRLTA